MSFFDYLFAVIPMLGVLIFVHELGHFLVAKWCGVRVLKFSLGFGPPIGFGNMRMRWERGGTEYVIAWFPLGGFVKMLGEEMQGVQGEEPDIVPDARPDEYLNNKNTWQKLAITFAGPAMNLVLPILAFMGVLAVGLPQPSPVVGTVEAHSPAAEAGLRAGDRILSIDGESVHNWFAVDREIREQRQPRVLLEIERAGERLDVPVSLKTDEALDPFGAVVEVGSIGIGHSRLPTLVGVPQRDSPAGRSGLASGDRVVRVAGAEVEDWTALASAFAQQAATGAVELSVERGSGPEAETLDIRVPAARDLAASGIVPAVVFVEQVSEGMPAAEAGLQRGDLILAVDGDPIGSFASFAQLVRASGGRELEIDYVRDGETTRVAIAPRERKIPGPYEIRGMEQTVYQVGISHLQPSLPGATHIEKVLNPLVSIPRAVDMTLQICSLFLQSLGKLFTGEVGLDKVSGPIGIAEVARKSLDNGWLDYLEKMIFISVNLGFLNLLPIPILDGGQALIIIVEGIKRSPISLRSRELVQQVGLTFILMLMGLAFWNDLSRHWGVFVEWLRGTGL